MPRLSSVAQHSRWRWPAALFLLVNAAIHLALAPMHLIEAPYVGALFISLLALTAFLASRTIGLPQIRDDIGNWADPLGYPNMVVEILTAAVTIAVLRSWRLRTPGKRSRSTRG